MYPFDPVECGWVSVRLARRNSAILRAPVHAAPTVRMFLKMNNERTQTVLILTGLAVLAAAVGFGLAGMLGLTLALFSVSALWFYTPAVPSQWILRATSARSLTRAMAPELFQIRDHLARRAGLTYAPHLYLTPDRQPQAFTIGERNDAVVVLSAGLLRMLSRRELTAVLAHEMSHVVHDDIRLLRFASTLSNVTAGLSRAATLGALLLLPLILTQTISFDPLTFLLVVASPWAAQVLLLSLSRTREYAADATAVRLTDDPEGLAWALVRIEQETRGLWSRLFGPRVRSLPAWMQTHPATRERVRRLALPQAAAEYRPAHRAGGALKARPLGAAPRGPGWGRRVVVRRRPRMTVLRAF